MNEQTLEDLLALIKLRNVSRAAKYRNISQSAYSRRLQAIEATHGANLVDRSGRPATPTPMLVGMTTEIESALANIKRVSRGLSRGYKENRTLSIAALHSLSSVPIPIAISNTQGLIAEHRIHLRSGNQSACFQRLMTEQVSLMLAYEIPELELDIPENLVNRTVVTNDWLVPVGTPILVEDLKDIKPGTEQIPLATYPDAIFLGQVIHRDLLTKSDHVFSHRLVAEMSSAIVSSTLAGIGIAWLPLSTIEKEITHGDLKLIDNPNFPKCKLTVSMLRLRTKKMEKLSPVCDALAQELKNTIQKSCALLKTSQI